MEGSVSAGGGSPDVGGSPVETGLFANDYANINDEAVSTIMHARKSLLFCDGDLWVKKSGAEFDVTMGSFDGAEVC